MSLETESQSKLENTNEIFSNIENLTDALQQDPKNHSLWKRRGAMLIESRLDFCALSDYEKALLLAKRKSFDDIAMKIGLAVNCMWPLAQLRTNANVHEPQYTMPVIAYLC